MLIINHEGEILNTKTEWHQPKIIKTTILRGGAEMAGGNDGWMPGGWKTGTQQSYRSGTKCKFNYNPTTTC